MLGVSLPVRFKNTEGEEIYEFSTVNDQYHLCDLTTGRNYRLEYKFPDDFKENMEHLLDWFTVDRLPPPAHCTYYQCQFTGLSHTVLDPNNLYILLGYVEKYRRYLLPIIIDMTPTEHRTLHFYMTGQPVYFNYNQQASVNLTSRIPELLIRHLNGQPHDERNINLLRLFTLNVSSVFYKMLNMV